MSGRKNILQERIPLELDNISNKKKQYVFKATLFREVKAWEKINSDVIAFKTWDKSLLFGDMIRHK